jgi:hypothetical protein
LDRQLFLAHWILPAGARTVTTILGAALPSDADLRQLSRTKALPAVAVTAAFAKRKMVGASHWAKMELANTH